MLPIRQKAFVIASIDKKVAAEQMEFAKIKQQQG